MATFYDIYQNYLKNPYGGINALPQVNPSSGIINTNTISPIGGDSMGVSPVTSINTDPNVTNTAPGTGIMGTNINFSDIGKFLNNPVVQGVGSFILGGLPALGNYAKGQVGGYLAGKAISPMVQARLAAEDSTGGFGGPQAGDLSYTDYSDADIGPMGPQAGDNTGNTNTNTGNTGFGDDNDGYGNDGDSSGVDSAGDGGDGYAKGGRVGYAEGSITQEGVIPGFTKLKNPDGAPGNYNEFMYEGPDGQIYGAGTYSSIAAGQYPNIYDPSKYTVGPDGNTYEIGSGRLAGGFTDSGSRYMIDFDKYYRDDAYRNEIDNLVKQQYDKTTPTMGESGGIITDGGLKYRINADGSRTLLDTAIEQTTPTVAEQIISTNNLSPFSSAPLTSVAEKLFPQGNFLNIKETATSPTEYNIKATEDLVKNLPGGIVKDIVAPTAAFALSLPYDAIQAYQRMEPGSGIQGFGKAFQAERPLESAFERFTGAAGPLAENINTAISSFNPFQQQQYMNYAVQNPEQAIAAAQQNKDFLEATRKNIAPTVSSPFLNAPKTPIGLFPGGGGGQTTPLIDEGPKTPIGLFPGGGGGQTTPLIDEGPKTPIGLFPNRGGSEIKPLMADGGRVFYLQGGLASLLG
jgi:hypothetical protein